MRHIKYIVMTAVAVVTVGCTGTDKGRQTTVAGQLPKDTVYTKKAAMSIYGYQPLRALQIVDSAVIVGNLGEVQADQCRARIYGMSLMTDQLDSLLGGPADVRLDTARAIGERLLRHDSIKGNLLRHRDVLEILTYVDRKRNDMQGWIERSREMVDVCRRISPEAETDALRMEAEIGAAYHETGRHKEGNPSDLSAMTDEQLYQYIDNIVIRELLFLDPNFGRDSIMDRFHLSKERVGAIFSKGSEYAKMSSYVLQLRLDYAAQLLLKHPDKSIVQIATDSGFSTSAYFSNCFRHHFGMTPTEYRHAANNH